MGQPIVSALMIAVFFYVLRRSVRRIEVRPWVVAWFANLGALAVLLLFPLVPQSTLLLFALRWAYLFCKTIFVVLLVLGTGRFHDWRRVAIAVALFSAIAAFVPRLGIVDSAIIAIVLTAGVVRVSGWLAAGFALRAAVAAVVIVAHVTNAPSLAMFLAADSPFVTGAEWVIALGCVLSLYRRIQKELTDSHTKLLAVKEELQDLVDRDSLTGLWNRRALPILFREKFERGATFLFFDLNDFKDVNDSYGHHMGDECLKTFARVLQASFRPGDHIIRFAGDEFVVVAPGVEPDALGERVESLRERLQFEQTSGGPRIRFSVGESHLPPNGDPEAALRSADEAMYRDKKAKTLKMKVPK